MATTAPQPVDPNVVRKFHFTREMIEDVLEDVPAVDRGEHAPDVE